MSFTSAAALPAFCPDLHDQDKDKQRVKTKTPHDRPERLISFGEVHHRTGLSRTTIWRLEGEGEFPRSVRISRGRRAWREADVSAWIEAKLSTNGEL
jgi:prophage regulatory protein